MNQPGRIGVVGFAAAAAIVSAGAGVAAAAAAQPVSGAGYYVAGEVSSGSMWFIVPTATCAPGENSSLSIGLQSAGVTSSSSIFGSAVGVRCVDGSPSVGAVQYDGNFGFIVDGVEAGDKVIISFDHTKGKEYLLDTRLGRASSVGIDSVANQAGVFFGAQANNGPASMIAGGKVTLAGLTVDGGTLAAALPTRQSKRVGGISLTPTVISATGKSFSIHEVNHNGA